MFGEYEDSQNDAQSDSEECITDSLNPLCIEQIIVYVFRLIEVINGVIFFQTNFSLSLIDITSRCTHLPVVGWGSVRL